MARFKQVTRAIFGAAFIAIGILHFVRPAPFVSIVPPYLPFPLALVYVSGIAEIALGILLQFRRTQRLAAWGLIALLIAVFPANLHMWLHPELFPGLSPTALLIRLPIQLALIAIAFWFTRPPAR